MDAAIYRYWAVPARWRRGSPLYRWAFATVAVGVSGGLACLPVFVWWPRGCFEGWDALWGVLVYVVVMAVYSVACTLAGAVTIARERERQTWEALIITPLGARAVLRARAICRIALCTAWLLPLVPFGLLWAAEMFEVNQAGPFTHDVGFRRLVAPRVAIWLTCFGVRALGHALPFTMLGVAFSAWSGRTRRAMVGSLVTIVAYVSAVVAVGSMSEHLSSATNDWLGTLLLWPVWPNLFPPGGNYTDDYDPGHLLPGCWMRNFAADGLWLAAIPCLFYLLSAWGCRRRG